MMRAALILTGLIVAGPARAADAEIEPLDADFLEYLANLEGDDADWTLLAETDEKPRTQPDSKPAPEAQPRKAAARPATEER